jgi:hypothetical protein
MDIATHINTKLYFTSAATKERSFALDNLSRMYNDHFNRIYLVFLASILEDVTNVNKKFQSENANALKLVDHAVDLYER